MKTFNKLMILIAVLFTCNNFAQFSYKNKNDFLTNNNLLDSNKMNLQNEVFILKSLKIFSSFEIKNQNTSKKNG